MMKKIRFAGEEDREKIAEAARAAGITAEDNGKDGVFLMMENDDRSISAAIGIKVNGKEGLLRSFILSPGTAPSDILHFFQQTVAAAEKTGVRQLFLVTPDRRFSPFFEAFGFKQVPNLQEEPATEVRGKIQELLHSEGEDGMLLCYDFDIVS
ncbi:hypothetical protein [Bacillus marinisedimentorum]|uniref:hypothetical protein n=1 Tax=Bacillus marinisedimentorum TaxID=1821260 RepID=UPI0007E0B349|nr:hypothetical protein [Bacillus marinisedimentorum]